MSGITSDRRFPRIPLIGAGALVGFVLLAATAVRLTGTPTMQPASTAIAMRDLTFEDRPDGSIAIMDAGTAKAVAILTGTNGFLRATMRGLAQARKRDGDGPVTPFRLTAWADGRLTIDDPTDGRHVELAAFGVDNEAAFARLLPLGGAKR